MTSELHPATAVESNHSVDSLRNTLLSVPTDSIELEQFPKNFRRHVRVDDVSGCWIWIGCICPNQKHPKHKYPYLRYRDGEKRRGTTASRWAYMHVHGPVPKGWDVDHLCQNKICVNPNHLEAVTHKENIRRRPFPIDYDPRSKAPCYPKNHCLRGHEYTPENTYVPSDGRRRCRACNKIRARAFREAHRG